MVGIYPQTNSPTLCRIWERLSEEGWDEEIATRKSEFKPGLMKIKGVVIARPLSEKGVHVPNP